MPKRLIIAQRVVWFSITIISLYFKVVIHQFSFGLAIATLVDVGLLALLSYFSIYLNSTFYEKRKVFYYWLLIVLAVFLTAGLRYLLEYLLFDFYKIPFHTFASRMITAKVLTTLIFVGFGTAYYISVNYFKRKDEVLNHKSQLLQLELDFLKARVNPHFLFNTLGNIHALIIQKSDAAADAVLDLSDLMRYMFYDCQEDKVLLQKEVDFLNNYIELYKIRSTRELAIDCQTDISSKTIQIEPLLFISFIENAFKHGDIYEGGTLKVRFSEKEGFLKFDCENSSLPKVESQTNKQSGFGIENVKKRLNLLYPDQHKVLVKKNENSFLVQLSINLNKVNESII
jgi:sensor histidine kinase YesM